MSQLTFGSVCRFCLLKLNLLTEPSNNGKCLLDIFCSEGKSSFIKASAWKNKYSQQLTVVYVYINIYSVCKQIATRVVVYLLTLWLFQFYNPVHAFIITATILYTGDTRHFLHVAIGS